MKSAGAEIHIEPLEGEGASALLMKISGKLDATAVGEIWPFALGHLQMHKPKKLLVEAAGLKYCDGSGVAFFQEVEKQLGSAIDFRSLDKEVESLLEFFGSLKPVEVEQREKTSSFIEQQGALLCAFVCDIRDQVEFLGSLTRCCIKKLPKPSSFRWKEVCRVSEDLGVQAVPIIVLIGALIGMIMAFQAAVPMKQFGAEIFVADLLGLSMVRELGPFMAAIILAGRSGSAFAAELGTMEVSDENNALRTMGLDPIEFLVVPRFLAAIFMLPILSLFCTGAALVGGAVVCSSLGIPVIIYVQRIIDILTVAGFLAGLIKAAVFGAIVAGIGCLRGLQTTGGPSGVGRSTTRSVVSGIILIVVADAVFSLVLYALDL